MEEQAETCIPWTTKVQFEPVFRLGDNMLESFSRLEQVERLCRKFPGLDCGSCGAPTCKALAEDIVRGEASEKDCVYHLRENCSGLSEEVAVLAEDLSDENRNQGETLSVLKEYIQKLSGEITGLARKEQKEREENDSTTAD